VRLLQRGVAVSVVVLAAMPRAGAAAAAESEHSIAACCPGDDTTVPLSAAGLGQSHPSAVDLSLDPMWQVYGFQRDGAAYFQVNDLAGRVQLIVGSMDGLYWALPAGETSSQVVLPPQQMPVLNAAVRTEVYRHPAFLLACYRTGDSVVWSVEVPSAAR
jgi:hypothetical protein